MNISIVLALMSIIIFSVLSFNIGDTFISKIKNFNQNFKIGKVLGISEVSDSFYSQKEAGWQFVNQAFSSAGLSKMNEAEKEANLPENKNKVYPQRIDQFEELNIQAKNSAAMDYDSGWFLFALDADKSVPIASITKLMTALVFLENNPGWDTVVKIEKEDRIEGGRIYLYWGEQMTVKDLFNFSLVGSDNTATMALARSTGLKLDEFVEKMNQKTKDLGMEKTIFFEPVGINDKNVSTAREVVLIAKNALDKDEIREVTLLKDYSFVTKEGRYKQVFTTDKLLENLPPNGLILLGGKTGYTEAAGYCFVGMFENEKGKKVISAVLGVNSGDVRFYESKSLNGWIFGNYEWQ